MDTTTTLTDTSFISKLSEILKPSSLLPALIAGGTAAVLLISLQLSYAAMVFSGELSPFMPRGIGLLLFGSFIVGILTAIKSSHPNCASMIQDAPVAILSLPLLAISAQMTADAASSESIFYTVVLTIVVATLVTGILMMLMARFKLGNFVRFIPYPVIGGFLAGIGWLLFKGGIGVMTGLSLDLSSLGGFLAPMVLLKWIPGLAFGLALYYLLRNYNHFLILPGMIMGAISIFFIVLLSFDISFSQAEANGWFLGPFPQGSLWKPISLAGLSQVRWDLVLGQSFTMGSVFIISVISLLLNTSGLELITKRDIDLNNELAVTGFSNILAAFAGSSPGYVGLSTSTLCYKLAPEKRLATIITVAICGVVLIAGASFLSWFPRSLAGAMLVFVGFGMLWEWLWDSFKKLPLTDYFLILVILLVIAFIGFLEGVAVGIVIAVILFVMTYSRIDIVKSSSSGKTLQSNLERPAPHRWLLDQKGDQILILQLHGFIFFGSANQLHNQIVGRTNQNDILPLGYIVLDFSNVNGFDSSALNSFQRIHQFTQSLEIYLVFVNVNPGFKEQFKKSGLTREAVQFYPNLDHGIEWCENQILETEENLSARKREQALESTFDQMLQSLEQLDVFEQLLTSMGDFLEPRSIETGQLLFPKKKAEGMYFIESGQISILLDQESGHPVRLRTMGGGTIIGDWGDCEQQGATTSVVIKKAGRILHLSNDNLIKMEKSKPEVAFQLFKYVTRTLSERLCKTNNIIQDLL
jgi:sulfate permease, SulP family